MNLGVFFSKCEGVVGKALDLEDLSKAYESYPAVRVFSNFYDAGNFDDLLSEVEDKKLDALILAGESHLSYRRTRNGELIFKCLAEKGVNPNRIEPVNLVNLVVRPHDAGRDTLMLKARLLVDVAIEKVRRSHDITALEISPRKSVAVVGADLAGIAAAQLLLDEGFKVCLVHENKSINLPADHLFHIEPTLVYISRHPRFTEMPESKVTDFYGYTGDYNLKIAQNGNGREISAGAVLLSLENNPALIKSAQRIFHVDVDEDGAIAPRDDISARSRTEDRGVFIINPPKTDGDTIGRKFVAADAAASMIINLLNRSEIHHRVSVSEVDAKLCSGCGACVKTCIFKAVSLQGDPPVSVIDPRRCRGCGNCVTACPAEARDLIVCPSAYMYGAVDILSKFKSGTKEPAMLVLACEGCGYRCLDNGAAAGLKWPVGLMPLRTVCGGQIDTQLVMHAFMKGFDDVILTVCGEGCCHNFIGNVELERRMNLFKEILASRGVDPERLHVVSTCSRRGNECVEQINEIYNRSVDI